MKKTTLKELAFYQTPCGNCLLPLMYHKTNQPAACLRFQPIDQIKSNKRRHSAEYRRNIYRGRKLMDALNLLAAVERLLEEGGSLLINEAANLKNAVGFEQMLVSCGEDPLSEKYIKQTSKFFGPLRGRKGK